MYENEYAPTREVSPEKPKVMKQNMRDCRAESTVGKRQVCLGTYTFSSHVCTSIATITAMQQREGTVFTLIAHTHSRTGSIRATKGEPHKDINKIYARQEASFPTMFDQTFLVSGRLTRILHVDVIASSTDDAADNVNFNISLFQRIM